MSSGHHLLYTIGNSGNRDRKVGEPVPAGSLGLPVFRSKRCVQPVAISAVSLTFAGGEECRPYSHHNQQVSLPAVAIMR